mmetsp:Transcript_20464/g.20838  ORF Transcript_20464/g.20838 Transcript_20464/m.20838 type:complete len:104 (+) Transcript_20464:229-540(+)
MMLVLRRICHVAVIVAVTSCLLVGSASGLSLQKSSKNNNNNQMHNNNNNNNTNATTAINKRPLSRSKREGFKFGSVMSRESFRRNKDKDHNNTSNKLLGSRAK